MALFLLNEERKRFGEFCGAGICASTGEPASSCGILAELKLLNGMLNCATLGGGELVGGRPKAFPGDFADWPGNGGVRLLRWTRRSVRLRALGPLFAKVLYITKYSEERRGMYSAF
jgi:hypothetical protein